MMRLRYPYFFYLLFGLASCCAVLLFVGGPGGDSGRVFGSVWELGHIVCFGLWAFLYAYWRKDSRFLPLLIVALLFTFLIGGAVELIQTQIGRDGDWLDLCHDLIGALVGILVYCWGWQNTARRTLVLFSAVALGLLVWSFVPLARVVYDESVEWRQFPLLCGFETPLEITRWSGSAVRSVDTGVAFSGTRSMRVELSTQRYSGLGLGDFSRSWEGFRYVELQVYNPEKEQLLLYFRIHDRQHDNAYTDRYNSSFSLHQGWNQLMVPLAAVRQAPRSRELDLNEVAGLGIFVGKLERSRVIYIDDVRLLP